MAGDWIKMRGNLWDDPRVARLCDLTDQGESAVIGGLYWLWATADQHSQDGTMPGLSLRQIDRKTGIQGFGQALCDIGWISESAEGIQIERFDEHNGASAKSRAQTAKRVANHKERTANDEVTHTALAESHETVSTALPREEKRREEKEEDKEQPVRAKRSPPPECPDDVEPQVWADWLALRKAKKAPASETVISQARSEAAKAGLTLAEFLRVWCIRGSQGLMAEWLKPDERGRSPPTAREQRQAETVRAWMGSALRPQTDEEPHGTTFALR